MGDVDDDIRAADLRNGEPDATDWTETDRTETDRTEPDRTEPGDTGNAGTGADERQPD